MDRRDFIKRGSLGASGAAGRLGVAGALTPESQAATAVEVDAFLERFDGSFARIEEWPLATSVPGFTGDPAVLNTLGRRSMQTLYAAGMFGDLSPDGQVDPRVQDRLWAAQSVMDESADSMMEFLRSRTDDHLERVRTTLRDRPEVLDHVVATLDEEVARSGVSAARRTQLNTLMRDIAWRLEHQPPSLMVNEFLAKAERAVASDVTSEARQRWMASRVGEKAFWQVQDTLRKRRISRGLRLMGIGALLFGAGALLVSVGEDSDVLMAIGLVPGITAGSIMFVVGLIILLVGAATSDDE